MAKQSKTQHVERRVLPRCPIDTDVEVAINSQGADMQFQTSSTNISLRGIELSCDDALIQAILAQKIYPHVCYIRFKLPGCVKDFEIQTQVVTHRRLSQHNYQLVLLFTSLNKSVQEKLLNELASFRVMTIHRDARTALAG